MLASSIYLISLFSSSFIEEEHEIWYYLETTQFYLLIFWSLDKWRKLHDLLGPISMIIATRILRSINQTGNKWIHLKDIADFLRESESKLSIVLCATLSVCAIYSIQYIARKRLLSNAKIWDLNYLLIYIYQLTVCTELFDLFTRNLIAQVSYSLLFINLLESLFKISKTTHNSKRKSILMFSFFDTTANYWLLFNCLIHPTANLFVLSLWQLKEYLLGISFSLFNSNGSQIKALFFYMIVNQMCFFSQGNSNSLNTIQVSTGMVGLNEMNMIVSGLLMICSTYSSNIYWTLIIMKHLLHEYVKEDNKLKNLKDVVSDIINCKTFVVTTICLLYTISAYLQREHLFVWSVFAPRLIYQLALLLVEYFILINLRLVHMLL